MQAIDLAIVGLYVLATIAIGLVARRRAAQSVEAYYLAGKSLPWYMLGLSNASGMFDISGTMWLVALCVVYGLKSIWIPWLWPVFNQVFLMVYLSTWLRRSNVLTGAEWIETRFGSGLGGELSQYVVIGFAVLSVLGFLAYGFIGIGSLHRDLPAVVAGRAVRAVRRRAPLRRELLRHHVHGDRRDLCGARRHVQHRVDRRPAVHRHGDRLGDRRRHRHAACRPGGPAGPDPRGLAHAVLRLDARPRLERRPRRVRRPHRERRLHDVRRLHDDAAVQGRAGERRRSRAQLRHAEDPLDALAARGGADERLRLGGAPADPLPDDRGLRGTRHRLLPRSRDHRGGPRRLRPHPARGHAPVRAARRARADRRGTARRIRLDVRRDAECGARLPRQRRLSAPHQSERQPAPADRALLCGVRRRRRGERADRPRDPEHQRDAGVDRLGAVGRIHRRQRAQVVLVALQRLRILRRDAGRHDRRARDYLRCWVRSFRRSRRMRSRSTASRCCCCCRWPVASSVRT